MFRGMGIALIVIGLVFLVMGLTATGSVFERVFSDVAGHYTQQTIWYIAGGLGAIFAGSVIVFNRAR